MFDTEGIKIEVAKVSVVRSELDNFGLPVIFPEVDNFHMSSWISSNLSEIDSYLNRYGALLLKGGYRGRDSSTIFQALSNTLLPYADQHTPRTQLGGGVYTSTEYPSDYIVPYHSENSKDESWPLKIYFLCRTPSAVCGETWIADNHSVYEKIDKEIRDEFISKGIIYVRNFSEGLGVSWKKALGLSTIGELKSFAEDHNYTLSIRSENNVHIEHSASVIQVHPLTKKHIWFNQANLFHPSTLDESLKGWLSSFLSEDEYPSYVKFGDNSGIPESYISHINMVYQECSVSRPWETGDLLILDNMWMAHARNKYKGDREILVAMSHLYDGSDNY